MFFFFFLQKFLDASEVSDSEAPFITSIITSMVDWYCIFLGSTK